MRFSVQARDGENSRKAYLVFSNTFLIFVTMIEQDKNTGVPVPKILNMLCHHFLLETIGGCDFSKR